jgi:hydroxyquinol 1,2-dioxygenase
VRHDSGKAPAPEVSPPWYSLEHTFVMQAGPNRLPRPPISGKAHGERPKIPHLA